MQRSEVAFQLAHTFPLPFRIALWLSAQGVIPRKIGQHWVSQELERRLWPDGDLVVLVEPLNLYIPRSLVRYYLNWEPMTGARLLASFQPGRTVIDVGAHVGFYTVQAAKRVGRRGRVYAFEPAPENLRLLRRNIRRNRLRNVTVYPVAAGAGRGRREFHLARHAELASVLNGFYPHISADSTTTMTVEEVPVDSLVESPVHIVKVDVEGAELEVLRGMKRILTENPDVQACIEWDWDNWRHAGHDPIELPTFLRQCGFRRFTVLDEFDQRERNLEETLGMSSWPPHPYWYVWATKA